MNATGVDISVWQDDNSTAQMYDPWLTRARGGSFVGIKVSQATWADPDYTLNWSRCRDVLYRMPYHFLTWDAEPRRQAETFWSLLERDPGELPLIVDFEWWKTTPPNAMDILYNALERLKQLSAPLPLGIYTAKSFWAEFGSKSSYWSQYALWLCDITGPVEVPLPWTGYDFRQFTFKLPGPAWGAESADLDGDYYNGTLEQMMARYHLKPLAAAPSPTGQMWRARYRMNIREAPGLNARSTGGLLQAGQIVEVTDYAWADGLNWIRHEAGWSAIGSAQFMEAV